jgi:molybdenum-dependent DNA-binding transcriptional regulator ModE
MGGWRAGQAEITERLQLLISESKKAERIHSALFSRIDSLQLTFCTNVADVLPLMLAVPL